MKKLYFLNEEEKERILRLHRNRKNQLDEQAVYSGIEHIGSSAAAGAGVGLAVGLGIPPLEAISIPAGALIGSVVGLVQSVSSGMDRGSFNSTINAACAKNGAGVPTMTETDMLNAAKQMNALINTPNPYSWGGHATEASRAGMTQILSSIPSLPDLCHIMLQYKNLYGISLLDDLTREIYYDSYYTAVVKEPLSTLVAKSLDLTKKDKDKDGTKTGDDADWEKTKLEFYKTYPCLADLAVASKAKNAIVVQNPSEHEQIIDQSQRKKTEITDKTTFLMDGTYVTYTDARANAISGKFQCSRDGELTLLTPGKSGMGTETNIFTKHPCLAHPRGSGDPYTEIDPSDNNQAIMSDEDRKEHPIFSGYPAGDIYFNIDGTFLTENDFNQDLDKTGRFKCRSKGRISAPPFKGVSNEPLPNTQEKKSSSGSGGVIPPVVGGMGTVMSSVQSEIAEILKCANITGTVLNQSNLNQLYQFIKNNKK